MAFACLVVKSSDKVRSCLTPNARAGLSIGTVKNIENKGQSSIESVVRLGLALGLADHFQELFNLQVKSIAQMDQVEQSKRIRAPRRVVK